MRFQLVLALVFIGSISSQAAAQRRISPAVKAMEKAKPAIVAVCCGKPTDKQAVAIGIIVDPKGVILAPQVFLPKDAEVHVVLDNGTKLPCKWLAVDEKLGVAFYQATSEMPLPSVVFADSSKVEVGDSVLAVSRPPGYGDSIVGMGIVSATNRELKGEPVIQLDSSTCGAGASGVVVDLDGRFVGLIPKENNGIGFAIPSNRLKDVMATIGKIN